MMTTTTTTNLQPTAIYYREGYWKGALAESEEIVWTCAHYHMNRNKQSCIPRDHSYQDHPHARSAIGCAVIELDRRRRLEAGG